MPDGNMSVKGSIFPTGGPLDFSFCISMLTLIQRNYSLACCGGPDSLLQRQWQLKDHFIAQDLNVMCQAFLGGGLKTPELREAILKDMQDLFPSL